MPQRCERARERQTRHTNRQSFNQRQTNTPRALPYVALLMAMSTTTDV